MNRPTNQEMFEWADHPADWQILPYATSQQEFDELRAFAVHERRNFLLDAALHEMHMRTGEVAGDSLEGAIDFREIPLKPVLTKQELCILANRLYTDQKSFIWRKSDASQFWDQLAGSYAALNGYTPNVSKYSTKQYLDESVFADAVDRSETLSQYGFSAAFLMDGLLNLRYASLDLDSLRDGLEAFHASHLGQVDAWVPRPVSFWEPIIKAVHSQYRREGKVSYADVVEEPVPGVFFAPYVPKSIAASPDFVTADDIFRFAGAHSDAPRQVGRLLHSFVEALDGADKAARERYDASRRWINFYEPYAHIEAIGAVFFRTERLFDVVEHLSTGGQRLALAVAESMLDASTTSDDYDRLVFGETF